MKYWAIAFFTLGVGACSASEGGDAWYDGDGLGSDGGSAPPGELDGDGGSGMAGSGNLPEEEEDESSYKAPVVTGRYLWSANPESGRVALIDGATLSVQVLSAGLFPSELSAVPSVGDDVSAIVLNAGSSDASWFRVASGQTTETRMKTHTGANRWSIGTSGQWAVAYSVVEGQQVLDPTEGLQELSVLRLDPASPTVTRLSVGYRPTKILVADGDARVVVVSEDGITLLSLGATPAVSAWIELGAASGRDVSLTPDGAYALVRRANDARVEVIALDAPDQSQFLDFSGAVTDLDLSPSGRALAVVRQQSKVVTFSFPSVLGSGEMHEASFPAETFGSAALTPDGARAVLYTNAAPNERVTVLDLSDGPGFLEGRSLSTKSPVWSVATTPDGNHAVVLGGTSAQASSSFSVLSLNEARFPRVVGTAAPVRDVALTNEAALVTTSSASGHAAYLVRLPGLSVTQVSLSTTPLSAGALPEFSLGFVAQAHSEGRVTFFDLVSAEARTLTGFELSAEVVDR